jgi:hypothetical protein
LRFFAAVDCGKFGEIKAFKILVKRIVFEIHRCKSENARRPKDSLKDRQA